jgi:hypothetical protein
VEEVKYNILDPKTIKYAERDDFIKSICGRHAPKAMEAEDAIVDIWNKTKAGHELRVKVDPNTVKLAQDYIKYRDKGARLPKFGRWATGMFKEDLRIAADLAAAGKYVEKSSDIVISGDIIDILRCADTPHFSSCFSKDSCYPDMPRKICEDTPGISIAYVDDEKGKMRGRVWVHHAQRIDNGKDVAIVCKHWGGTVTAEQVVDLIRLGGAEAYVGGSYGGQHRGNNGIDVKFINCFDHSLHHDMYTWINPFKVHDSLAPRSSNESVQYL